MDFWRWDSTLSSDEIKAMVVARLFARTNQVAAGPTCSLFAEAQRQERRRGNTPGAMPRQERRRYRTAC